MPKAGIGRVILAMIMGWIANAMLVGVTEVLLWMGMRRVGGKLPLRYYVIDLILQCCYTVVGGYLSCLIVDGSRRAAMFGLMALGLVIGGLSLPASWPREPHWYRIALLAVWVPCVWIGWRLKAQKGERVAKSRHAEIR